MIATCIIFILVFLAISIGWSVRASDEKERFEHWIDYQEAKKKVGKK